MHLLVQQEGEAEKETFFLVHNRDAVKSEGTSRRTVPAEGRQ